MKQYTGSSGASEERYRTLVESSLDMIFMTDADGSFLQINNSTTATLGYSAEELYEINGFDLVHPDDLEKVREAYGNMLKGERIVGLIYRCFRKDGESLCVLMNANPVFNDDGDFEYCVGIAHDISDRHKTEPIMETRARILDRSRKLGLNDLMMLVIDEIERVTESNIGFYHFVDEDSGDIQLQVWSTNTVKNMCSAVPVARHYNIADAGVWVDCIHQRKSLIHNDYEALEHKKGMPEGHAPVVRQLLAPVFRNGKIVAIASVGNKNGNYTGRDLEIAENIADFAWEIVGRKKAEMELKDSYSLNQQIIKNARNGIVVYDRDLRYVVFNPYMETMSRAEAADVIGKTPLEAFPFLNNTGLMQMLERVVREGKQITQEFRYINPVTGKVMWTEDSSTPIFDSNGEVISIVGVVRDITEDKEFESRMTGLFHDSPISLWEEDMTGVRARFDEFRAEGITDLGAHLDANPGELENLAMAVRIVDVNKATLKLFGAETLEDFRDSLNVIFDREAFNGFRRLMEALYSGEFSVELETVNCTLEGAQIDIFLKAQVAPGHEAELDRVYVSLIDISEQKKARELEKNLSEQEKVAAIGKVAGKMAHDFNNVLGIISGASEYLLSEDIPEEIRPEIEAIRHSAMRGREITQNLLAFARDKEPKYRRFDLNATINHLMKSMRKELQGMEVVTILGPGPDQFTGDPGLIENAIINLVMNAAHAMSRTVEPKLVIRTALEGDTVVIEVVDNGCGIPESAVDKIFEPSFTLKGSMDADGSYDRKIRGSGYGLSNVKRTADKHKGRVAFETVAGSGTTFRMEIPVVDVEIEEEEVRRAYVNGVVGRRVLLVEDEPDFSRILANLLKKFDHRVDVAEDGETAIAFFRNNKYDIISLDFMLPDTNGMSVYEEIRRKDKDVPIIFVSGNMEFQKSMLDLKKNDPVTDHLPKPFSNIDYLSIINNWLSRSLSAE